MTNAFREKRMTSLEISMSDLKELVAETSRQVDRTSARVDQFCEKSDRDRIVSEAKIDKFCEQADRDRVLSEAKIDKFCQNADREREAFREEMRQKYETFSRESQKERDALSKRSEEERTAFREEMRQKYEASSKQSKEFIEASSKESKEFIESFSKEMNDLFEKHVAKMDEETRRYNLEIGRIANKHGTMVEDLVGPSIGRILRETLGVDEDTLCWEQIRVKRPYRGDKSRRREFDAIADCLDYALINETKSDLRPKDIDEFLVTMSSVRDYFPEYADYKLIGAVAALHIEEGVVNYATKKGLLALAVGIELMDVQNPPGFRPKVW